VAKQHVKKGTFFGTWHLSLPSLVEAGGLMLELHPVPS